MSILQHIPWPLYLVVHINIYRDGGNRSGTFVACMNGLDQVKVEQHVDIFQIVRMLRMRSSIKLFTKYYQDYLRQFETYSNFI